MLVNNYIQPISSANQFIYFESKYNILKKNEITGEKY